MKQYIEQYREVEKFTRGFSMDEVHDFFGEEISNDFVEGEERIIDANYKDILVTFVGNINDNIAELQKCIEVYSKEGMLLDKFMVE